MRQYRLDRAFDEVQRRMALRRPQLLALRSFHDLFQKFPRPLAELSGEELSQYARDWHPEWDHSAGFPEMTCALATGVGKTRLMGALAAYLFKAGESKNFLMLAPRSTIVGKLLRESQTVDDKYLFVDRGWISQPVVYHSGNFESFDPREHEMRKDAPAVWILSPQGITGDRRFHRRSEYIGVSPAEFLSSQKDLVVFFDESHHLGDVTPKGLSAWAAAVRSLSPKLLFGMTASPRGQANQLYAYPIQQCLQEGLYTKAARVIVDQRPADIDDWEWDKATLRTGIARLKAKENALDSLTAKGMPQVRPVMLVSAADTAHADDVARWLRGQVGDEAVLTVHSNQSEANYLQPLLEVESPTSRVKIVVNVGMLTEGWDVNNVYVIAPLRAMSTTTIVLQTMGRGLRLPFGTRVDDDEADTLDILCFGRETMSDIVDTLLAEGFGDKEDSTQHIEVVQREEEAPAVKESAFLVKRSADAPTQLEYPEVRWARNQIDLADLQLSAVDDASPLYVDVSDPATIRRLDGQSGFDRSSFLSMVLSQIFRKRSVLGAVSDREATKRALDAFLDTHGYAKDDLVTLDPGYVALLALRAIDNAVKATEPTYVASEGIKRVKLEDYSINHPNLEPAPLPHTSAWRTSRKRMPFDGWSRCAFQAAAFDTEQEFRVAKVVDRSPDIEWWIRNEARFVTLRTPAGGYAPDFLLVLKLKDRTVLLELKGEFLAAGPGSDSIIKARAADTWCKALSKLKTHGKWEHWFVMARDAGRASTLGDLEKAANEWRSLNIFES
jgi:superfamily II DNA or RNA helicase